jgi:hypothetical protein
MLASITDSTYFGCCIDFDKMRKATQEAFSADELGGEHAKEPCRGGAAASFDRLGFARAGGHEPCGNLCKLFQSRFQIVGDFGRDDGDRTNVFSNRRYAQGNSQLNRFSTDVRKIILVAFRFLPQTDIGRVCLG